MMTASNNQLLSDVNRHLTVLVSGDPSSREPLIKELAAFRSALDRADDENDLVRWLFIEHKLGAQLLVAIGLNPTERLQSAWFRWAGSLQGRLRALEHHAQTVDVHEWLAEARNYEADALRMLG